MVLWATGGIALVLIIGAIALQIAISRNGPAVLSAVDRVVGGSGDAELKATISTGDHAQQKLLVWGPEDDAASGNPLPVLVFVHGGSWRSGDPADYGFVGRAFVPKGFVVVLGGYRLEEAGVYPAMLDDTARVIGWTRREIARFGGDPDRITIAGHSAGAYNVVMNALEAKWLEQHGMTPSDIAGVVGLSGPYDFFPFDSDSTIAAFGGASDGQATQPVHHSDNPAPPMLLIHGMEDTLVRPRNTQALSRDVKAADGNVIAIFPEEMDHNQPLISLAAPFRNNSTIAQTIADFAMAANRKGGLSVPVKPDTR